MYCIKIALVSGTQSRSGLRAKDDRVGGIRSGAYCPSRRPAGINSGRSLHKIYNGVPEYSSPDPQNIESYKSRKWLTTRSSSPTGTDRTSIRKWWEYAIPTARVGFHVYGLSLGGTPPYGPPGGNGGSGGGGGGWGGGNSGDGDPMKGFTYLFAFSIFGSGLVAYARKSSTTSLLVSTGVAVLLLISASLMGNPTYKVGTLLSLATCLSLAGIMGYRAKNSGKLFPAGAVALISSLMSVGYIVTLL
eukprot:jgi/Picsp_1/676/NSC_00671-R1_hypothetical protein CHLNCDRAFT_138064 [Chlorella variabilis]